MPETINIDGRGMTIRDAVKEMWDRMQPLEARGFHPISGVEIVDATNNKVIQSFELTGPEFQAHLKSDKLETSQPAGSRLDERPHAPEKKEHYAYLARISLEL
ncbi:MAG: hypothetical protein OK455_09365 [Thaumarchaeota archaeon]|nr:hypothetical protein [Nitrososphaerota archaeon]